MRKTAALILIFIMICSLWGCSGEGSVNTAETSVPLPYTYSCVKCIDNRTGDIKDGLTVIKSVDELTAYKESISSSFDLDKGILGEDSATLNQKFSVFNEKFFTDKILVISRRNFVTEDVLTLVDANMSGTSATINSNLSVGGKYEESVRFFLIQVKTEHFVNITDISLKVTSEETTSGEYNNAMLISKGESAYKSVTDSDKIAEIQQIINSYKYTESSESLEEYDVGLTDIAISYQGYVALFTDKFIYIDGQAYAPRPDVKQRIVDYYNALTEAAQTVPAEPFDSDETTSKDSSEH